MTGKQERFVEAFAITQNASEAARTAGYSEKTAGEIGYENLRKPDIRVAIEERTAEIREKFLNKADEAAQTLFDLSADPNTPPAVRVNAAKEILDRAGLKPVDKSELNISANAKDLDVTERARAILAERIQAGTINMIPQYVEGADTENANECGTM